ncbi:CAX-interacting protein 4 [Ipomoea triloba]|uniref:CAX-interacting protein 4 n=1 Tax=Ipomoea triloba TaxID=35885 RepID=UPI00125E0FA6|nr:CAX-interacting protein 4 [Ipomoea triloba]
MPATAGRVRMPANNRVHSSAALQTHGIWQSAIGYDPYAPNKDDSKKSAPKSAGSAAEPDNPYANFQGLLALARITGSNADEARGACKKCGRVGHLTYQCRNFLSVKEDSGKDKDEEGIEAAVLSRLEKWKGKKATAESEESSEEEESESSDSEYDSEMERAIAEKYGKNSKKVSRKVKSSGKSKNDGLDDDDSDSAERKKRGRSKKRRSGKRGHEDSEEENEEKDRRKRRKEKRRRRDESSDDDEERHRRKRKSRKEKRRRRSHRHPSDSDESSDDSPPRRKRRSRRSGTSSDSDACSSDDLRVGRDKKRSEKRSRNCHDDD